MKITRIYADADGESHFEDLEVAFAHTSAVGRVSDPIPATGLLFREAPADYDLDWHNAPRRQYVINLDGSVQITASDGETRVIGAGEVFLAEDTTGKGHVSKTVDNQVRNCVFVTLD